MLGSHDRGEVTVAHGLANVDAGVVVVDAPATSTGTGTFLRQVLRALGVPPPPTPRPGVAFDHALALAWLRALAIRDLVVVHADWLGRGLAFEALRALTAAGPDVYLLSQRDPGARPSPLLEGWCSETWRWGRFAAWAAARASAQTPEARAQCEGLPVLGLTGAPRRVPPLAGARGPSADAYEAVRRRARPDRPSWHAAHVARQVLAGSGAAAGPALLEGVAAGLEEQGYSLLDAPGAAVVPTWCDLRRLGHPQGPALVGIHAAGAGPRALAQLRIADVAADGSGVRLGARALPVPRGARPFVHAQRLLRLAVGRDAGDVFFAEASDGLTVDQVREQLSATLAAVGAHLQPGDIGERIAPSQAWLWARGLSVQRTARAAALADARAEAEAAARGTSIRDPRCRHGLRPTLVVGRDTLSHSQLLCRAHDPEETRPLWRGYAVRQLEERGRGRTWRVSQDGVDAGWLWSVETPLGRAWLEKGGGHMPGLGEVVAASDALQHERTRRAAPGPAAPRRQTDGSATR